MPGILPAGVASMTCDATTIANRFLEKAREAGRVLTPMQLIKLVYIAHGWHLGYFGRPLINEGVQAWKFGPVVNSLYHKVKHYGSGGVAGQLSVYPWQSTDSIPPQSLSLVDSVWNSYQQFSGMQLSEMTHREGTPWEVTWNELGGSQSRNVKIDDSIIEKHYREKIETAQKHSATTA